MYTVPRIFSANEIPAGTHILGKSPPMIGMQDFAYEFIAQGLAVGEYCIIIATDNSADQIAREIKDIDPTIDLSRLGIVDVNGNTSPLEEFEYSVQVVDTASDLTGVGISISKLFKEFSEQGAEKYRFLISSLSTLLVYTDFQRVCRFVHTLMKQLNQVDSVSLSLAGVETRQDEYKRLEASFTGVVELRSNDGVVEFRRRGNIDTQSWKDIEIDVEPAEVAPLDSKNIAKTDNTVPFESPSSFREMIDALHANGYTLTLCNYTGNDDFWAELRGYFERLNVTVCKETLSADTPEDVALLHRGPEVVAMSPVPELQSAIRMDTIDVTGEVESTARPDVLDPVHRNEYSVRNGLKKEMIRVSRLIETQALETGSGTLHAGFQRLNRMQDEIGTRELYKTIAEAGITTHVYGSEGVVPDEELYITHEDSGEIANAWFVVYDGGGDNSRKAALVSEEVAPKTYTGVWTHQPEIVDAIIEYIDTTYLV